MIRMNKVNNKDNYKRRYNQLTVQLLQHLYKEKSSGNVVISPLSVLILLSIAADATAGDTRDEILKYLGDEISGEELISMLKELNQTLNKTRELKSANAVCVKDKFKDTINPKYRKNFRNDFNGKLFVSKQIVKDINGWVSKKTNGMVKEILDEVSPDFRLALMNATAFDAKWKERYEDDDIYEDEFTCADGTVKEAKMLHSTENEYIKTGDFKGFVKPYKSGKYSFMALLPRKKYNMLSVLKECDFTELYKGRTNEEVFTVLPEFKYDFFTDLKDYLNEEGINTLFTADVELTPLSYEQLELDSIIHKARIEVDRSGTRAAAVSAMEFETGCAPEYEEVLLTRPFIYAIMHNESELPMFVGAVNSIDGTEKSDPQDEETTFDENMFHPMPNKADSRPAQIPITKERLNYLTKIYTPNKKDDWIMFHHPGHFVIYDRLSRTCLYDASYLILNDSLKANEDEETIVAVIPQFLINPNSDGA